MAIFYTMVDAEGAIVRSQYTDNPDAAVHEGHRLLPDTTPEPPEPVGVVTVGVYTRMEPVAVDATAIEYVYTQRPIEAVSDEMRAYRNHLLLDSDWSQLTDAPLTQEQVQLWQGYRQALRNLPEQSGFPYNVIFPTIP